MFTFCMLTSGGLEFFCSDKLVFPEYTQAFSVVDLLILILQLLKVLFSLASSVALWMVVSYWSRYSWSQRMNPHDLKVPCGVLDLHDAP